MLYYLMRKDNILGLLDIDNNGQLLKYQIIDNNNPELPLAHRYEPNYLKKWWDDRSIPLSRGKVDQMLKEKGLLDGKQYLLNNLALSLTDYYWIKPVESNYTWKQVNLFDNPFKDDMHIFKKNNGKAFFTPNSSLQGDLEKTWLIMNDDRVLVKSNHNECSQESINEVIATMFHKKQGYKNYVKYNLIELKGTEYKYACYCKAFTNNKVEFVSAYDLLTSEKKTNDISDYEFLIKLAVKHGINEKQLRNDLEYQIMSDYILSNKDRHMNNIGFLRDYKSLKLLSMAPIFDTGNSMFNDSLIPNNLSKLKINSFVKSEEKIMKYVTNYKLLDTNKILSSDVIKNEYLKDPNFDINRINEICGAYNRKIELFKSIIKRK